MDERRTQVAILTREGKSQCQIAAALNISPRTVRRDIRRVQEAWQRFATGEFAELVRERLVQLERIRDEAWERHKSAIGPHEKNREKVTTGGQHGGGSESVTETEDLNGDARFLKIALDAEAQMTRIIGAEKPIKHALTDADGNAIPFAVVRFAEMPSRPLPEVTDGGDSAPSGD